MDELCRYAGHPFRFVFRYLRRRADLATASFLAAVLGAVRLFGHDTNTFEYLVDTLPERRGAASGSHLRCCRAHRRRHLAVARRGWIGALPSWRDGRPAARPVPAISPGHSPSYFATVCRAWLTSRVTGPRTPSTPSRTCHLESACRRCRDPGGDRLRHHVSGKMGADAQRGCRHRGRRDVRLAAAGSRCITNSPTRAPPSTVK